MVRRSEDDTSRDHQSDLRPRVGRADHSQLASDASRALAYSLKSEMPLFPFLQYRRVDTHTVVADTHTQILRIAESHFQSSTHGMHASVANRFVRDAVDLVTNNWVHLLSRSDHGEGCFDGAVQSALFYRVLQSLPKIVPLLGRTSKGV